VQRQASGTERGRRAADRKQAQREAWIAAARDLLIDGGIGALSLRKLAERLAQTTGAFYAHFRGLEDLLDCLREDWVEANTTPFTRAIAAAGEDGMRQYMSYVRVLVLDNTFDPRYDNAIRDWAHHCETTAAVLRDVEVFRIEQLRGVFEALGFGGRAALIRARVTYFHQTGYNAMQIRESLDERLGNIPYYTEILTDRRDLLGMRTPDEVRAYLEATRSPPPGSDG
jgi:AcrR family transcriptional regulator